MRTNSGVRSWLVSVVLIAVIIASFIPARAQDSDDATATYQGNVARTGVQSGAGPDFSGEIINRWVIDLDVPGDLPFGATSAKSGVTIHGGVGYFGGIDGSIRAINPLTGEEHWSAGSGLPKIGSPAIADGVLYILDLGNTLHAVDTADGSPRWTITFGESFSRAPNNGYAGVPSPAVVDGVVFIGALDGVVYALDAESGVERWSNNLEGNIYTPVAVDDGRVFISSGWPSKIIRAIDAGSGDTLWDATNPNQSNADGLIAANGLLHLQHFWGVATFDAVNGELIWELFGDSGSERVVPVLLDSTLVFGTGGSIFAVDAADGSLTWRLDLSGSYKFVSPFIAADGVLYGRLMNSIYAIDLETGEEIGNVSIGYTAFGSGAITVYERLLISRSDAGQFMAIGGPSDAMLAETAEAEAAAETATAEAFQTATAIAEIEATASAEAAITATAAAEIRDAERAYLAQWEAWAQAVGAAMTSSPDFPASFTLGSPDVDILDGAGEPHVAAYYEVAISDTSEAMVLVGIFNTEEDAAADYAASVDSAIRSGFQRESIDGLGDDATCFTMVNDGESTAGCVILRGDTILIVQAVIGADAREAALLNASDLARLIDDAVVQTPRP